MHDRKPSPHFRLSCNLARCFIRYLRRCQRSPLLKAAHSIRLPSVHYGHSFNYWGEVADPEGFATTGGARASRCAILCLHDRAPERRLNLGEGVVGPDAGVPLLGGCSRLVAQRAAYCFDRRAAVLGLLGERRPEGLEPAELHAAPLHEIGLDLPQPGIAWLCDTLSARPGPAQRNQQVVLIRAEVFGPLREVVRDCGPGLLDDGCEVPRRPRSLALRMRHIDAHPVEVEVCELGKPDLLGAQPAER